MFLVGNSSAMILGCSGLKLCLHLQLNLLQVAETLVQRKMDALRCNTSLNALKVVSMRNVFLALSFPARIEL